MSIPHAVSTPTSLTKKHIAGGAIPGIGMRSNAFYVKDQ
jgi:hypothetical protein